MNINFKIFILAFFSLTFFVSSLYFIGQTYDYRKSYSNLDSLRSINSELSFKENILIEEVEYLRNQTNLRKLATEGLGMRPPKVTEMKFINFSRKP